MEVVDHSNTMVLLIGASTFPEDPSINPIPNVKANIDELIKCLINPNIIGIPEANIIISLDDEKGIIEKKLRDIAELTNNKKFTLFVYYTGHGILSSEDYKLYLTTKQTSKKYLEIYGINIENFKKYIKKSNAGRKVVLLDCCHSGAIIGAMNDLSSTVQAEIKGFEGTYVMTSAAEDTPSLFPIESPKMPTFFTGKFIEIVNDGLESENEYCTLREIYNRIEYDLSQAGLPRPQQSNYNSVDQWYFSRNRRFAKPHFTNKPRKKELHNNNNFNNSDAQIPSQIIKSKVVTQYDLGLKYANGDGVNQSFREALKWFRLAADKGHDSAQFSLGMMYQYGQGVEQNYIEAVKWYSQAAKNGHAAAQNNLGLMYQNGQGVIKDNLKAIMWYQKATEQGNTLAKENLYRLLKIYKEADKLIIPNVDFFELEVKTIFEGFAHSGGCLYIDPSIPSKKLSNAIKSCHVPDNEKIIGLIDNTLLGSAKDCLLFGLTGIYFHNSWGTYKPGSDRLYYRDFIHRVFKPKGKGENLYDVDLGNNQFYHHSGSFPYLEDIISILNSIQKLLKKNN